MASLRFNQSRRPAQNMRWGMRHGAYLFALLAALAMVERGDSSLDLAVLSAVILGAVYNTCYCLGYFFIAAFWFASKKFPWLAKLHVKHSSAIEDIENWHQDALNDFRSTKVRSSNPHLEFDGSKAQILKTEKSGESHRPQRSEFMVTIYCRNHAGEYFLFKKIGENKPYVRHIRKSVAETTLGLAGGEQQH